MPSKPRLVGLIVALMAGGAATALGQGRASAEVALSRGIDAFMADDYAAARKHFEAALRSDPEFAAGHYFLGLTLLQQAGQASDAAAKSALLEQALSEFEQSRVRDPQLVLAYLDGAIATALLGRFEQAESGFRRFLQERPDDPLPYLFLAVLYYRQARDNPDNLPKAIENLDQAEAALKRSGREDRGLEAYIRFYRALIHLQKRDRGAAREELQKGYELAPESAIREQTRKLLEQIDRGELGTRRPWDLTIQAGFDYDTNVPLRGDNVRPQPGEDTSRRDFRFGLATAFTYRFVDTEDLVLGAGGYTYDSWHCNIHEFNVQTYGGNLYAGYTPPGLRWMTLGTRYDYDFSLVGNDSFLSRNRITPQIDVQEAEWTRSTLFYQYDARDYRQPPEDDDWRLDRSGDTHAVGLAQSFELWELFERKLTANLSYRFENESTDGTEYATRNCIFGAGFGVPLPRDMLFDFSSEWEISRYKNPSVLDSADARRHDNINTLIFGLAKRFDEHLSMRFEVNITDADSNVVDRGQQIFTYDRVIYGLTLAYQF